MAFHHEPVFTRHDVHNGVARRDHPAQGVDAEPDDLAVRGRDDSGPLQHVRYRVDAFAGLEPLLLRRGDLVGHLPAPAVFNLQDLLAGLADLHPGRGDVRGQGAQVADGLLVFALAADEHAFINQLPVHEGDQAFQVLLDQAALAQQGLPARLQAAYLFLKLDDAVAQHLYLPAVLAPPHLEQVFLHRQDIGDDRVVAPRQQFVGEGDLLLQQALGVEPVDLRQPAVIAAFQELELGAVLGLAELDEDVTGFDLAALTHVEVLDNAALQVLDGLVLRVHHHGAHGDHAFGQGRQGGPGEEPAQCDGDDDDAPAHHHVAGHQGLQFLPLVRGIPGQADFLFLGPAQQGGGVAVEALQPVGYRADGRVKRRLFCFCCHCLFHG